MATPEERPAFPRDGLRQNAPMNARRRRALRRPALSRPALSRPALRRPSSPPRRHRRRLVVAAVVVAVIVAGTVTGLLLGAGGSAPMKPILARPTAYQVVYRATSTATGNAVTTWEVLTVHRPFDSSDITYNADPAANPGPPHSATWFDIDTLYTLDGTNTVRRVSGRQPGLAGSDQALGIELNDLVKRKLAKNLGHAETVAGRRCQLVRFAEPPVGPVKPLGHDRDDICLDGDGLILAESYSISGRLVYQRTAVRLHIGPVSDPMSPTDAQPLPGGKSEGTTKKGVDPNAPIAAPATPAGYVAAPPEIFTLPAPTGSGLAAQSTVWAFSRGPDVVVVEAGFEGGGGYPWNGQQTRTAPVHLAGLGNGTSVLTSEGPQLQVPLGPGSWVRVSGTVPLPALVTFAQQLKRKG